MEALCLVASYFVSTDIFSVNQVLTNGISCPLQNGELKSKPLRDCFETVWLLESVIDTGFTEFLYLTISKQVTQNHVEYCSTGPKVSDLVNSDMVSVSIDPCLQDCHTGGVSQVKSW